MCWAILNNQNRHFGPPSWGPDLYETINLTRSHRSAIPHEFAGVVVIHADQLCGEPIVSVDPTAHPTWIIRHQKVFCSYANFSGTSCWCVKSENCTSVYTGLIVRQGQKKCAGRIAIS